MLMDLVPPPGALWQDFESVTSCAGDDCREMGWVVAGGAQVRSLLLPVLVGLRVHYVDHYYQGIVFGRITHILQFRGPPFPRVVVLNQYQLGNSRHPIFDMPVLFSPTGDTNPVVVGAEVSSHICRPPSLPPG